MVELTVCQPYHRHHEVTDGPCGGAGHLDVCEEVQGLQDPHVSAGGDAAAPHGPTQPLKQWPKHLHRRKTYSLVTFLTSHESEIKL